MIINCGMCGKQIEVGLEVAEGQNVLCPFCNRKFIYRGLLQEESMRKAHGTSGQSSASQSNRGGIVKSAFIITVLIGIVVFGFMKFKAYKEQQELEAQRQLAEERAQVEKAEAERKAKEERVRKEKEEREAKQKREREEREAKLERERQERLQKEREEEEARQKAAKEEAARERYRRAHDAFSNKETAFYSDAPEEQRVGATVATFWYVDESFADDKRIYEVKTSSVEILYPDKASQTSDAASLIASLESKPGLLVGERNVWICGAGKSVKSYVVPKKGKVLAPFDYELGGLLDVSLSLGVNPPRSRYKVALRVKGSRKVFVLGTFGATDAVSREMMENAVRDDLNKRLGGGKQSLSASAVEDYLATCELIVRREGKEEDRTSEDKPRRQKTQQSCYKCHGKGMVVMSVRETCDECGGMGVIERDVVLRNKAWGDSRWGERQKNSKTRISCQKCRRSGKVSVKKEVECPTCHGTGTR